MGASKPKLTEIYAYFRQHPPETPADIVSVTKLVMKLKAHPGNRDYMPQYNELLKIYNRLKQ